jgi:hypothetical protein
MPNLRKVLEIAVVLMLLGALVAPGAVAEQPDKQVPLKGEFVGVGAEFSGNFSHLGRFDGLADLATSTATWTSANGDTVTNMTTSFVIDFGDEVAPGVFTYEQTIVITGGTGRFQDATGEASITGTIDPVGFVYDGYLNGSISQPGPRR